MEPTPIVYPRPAPGKSGGKGKGKRKGTGIKKGGHSVSNKGRLKKKGEPAYPYRYDRDYLGR